MLQGVFKRGRMSKWIYKSGNVEKEINGSKQMRRRMDSSWQEKSVQEEKRLRRGGGFKRQKRVENEYNGNRSQRYSEFRTNRGSKSYKMR